jgi:hypothetical protein|tara:strand:+ start:122 stop:421 length:300 start_codon:yes stop_codon:yes gene_type:complete
MENLKRVLGQKEWNANDSSVWREIVSRWGQADYDDVSKRAGHEDTLKLEWDAQVYARNRASAFPSTGDQLDMQYHDQLDGTTTWKDAVAKVKADNPKPE